MIYKPRLGFSESWENQASFRIVLKKGGFHAFLVPESLSMGPPALPDRRQSTNPIFVQGSALGNLRASFAIGAAALLWYEVSAALAGRVANE
jgi:hypothetical protein